MKLLSTAAAACAIALLSTSPAYADVRSFRDARGDVNHGADLWRVTVDNGDVVKVRTKHDNLRPHPKRAAGMTVYFDTDLTSPGPELAFATGLMDGTDYVLSRVEDWQLVGEPVACRYVLRLDYVKDVARMRFARACFGDGDRLRVAVEVGVERRNGTVARDWLTAPRRLTPPVLRG